MTYSSCTTAWEAKIVSVHVAGPGVFDVSYTVEVMVSTDVFESRSLEVETLRYV